MLRAAAIATLLGLLSLGTFAATPKKSSAKKPAVKKTSAKKTTAKKSSTKRRPVRRTVRRVPRPPVVSQKVKLSSQQFVAGSLDAVSAAAIENSAALIPFFEQLHQMESTDGGPQTIRVLQYGDSHTASDDWANQIRSLFQSRFGNAGPGYVFAGTPFPGYRRRDAKSGQSKHWSTEGLLTRGTDGLYGLGGAALITELPGQEIFLEAEGDRAELHFLRQPGGGSLRVTIDGEEVTQIDTDGELSPGVWHSSTLPSSTPHRFVVETLSDRPVKLFGWVTEKNRGLTWETLGINGAQANISLRWEEAQLGAFLSQRDPALLVLAYGTNDARSKEWTPESYAAMFRQVVERFRRLAPTASILIVGPPDNALRTRRTWAPVPKLDMIADVQRSVAQELGCAFWDLRQRMGGDGAIKRWVYAGYAQGDFVHLNEAGYRLVGETLYKDLIAHYEEFRRIRNKVFQDVNLEGTHEPARPNP